MAPPTETLNLNVEAISGICGSISIACWVVVFSPQILQNLQRSSADGLSIQFIIVWLLGDVFNIMGAVLQGVLPTMIILAIYYTIADLVLLLQCFYYRGFTWKDEVKPALKNPANRANRANGANGMIEPDEYTALLHNGLVRERRGSNWSHLSPAVPLVPESPKTPPPAPTILQTILWNTLAVVMVCLAGVMGWFLSIRKSGSSDDSTHDGTDTVLVFSLWGQIFGYFCAALYILSRIPQLILNWRRKSTDGLSMLFFLFACLGNVTYVLSIFIYDAKCENKECVPGEASRIYWRYILVNLSWICGSAITLLLDLGVFVQYFMYNKDEDQFSTDSEGDVESIDETVWDRPLLARGDSTYG